MSTSRVTTWLSDRINPIVVKEVRQAVRSKGYIGLYFFLLGVSVIISMVACAGQEEAGSGRAVGGEVFFGFLTCLGLAGLIIPLMAFQGLTSERLENTYELLNVSGLAPGRLVRGKLGAATIELALIYSAFVPFMAFTYFLGGIDLLVMVLFIVGMFVLSVFTIMLAITVSTLATTKRSSAVAQVLFIMFAAGGGLSALIAGLEAAFGIRRGLPGPAFWFGDLGELGWFLAVAGVIQGSYFVILYLLAVSRLTFAADNRSTALRIAVLAQTLLFTGIQIYAVSSSTALGHEWWVTFGSLMVIQWGLVGVCVTTETDGLSRRVAVSVPRRRLFRVLFGAFWPGRSRGWAFLALGLGLVLAATYLGLGEWPLPLRLPPGHGLLPGLYWDTYYPVTLAAHAVIYLALTDLLFRTVLRRWRTPTAQRVGVFLLVGIGSVFPFFVEAGLGTPAATARWLYCLNPFALGMPRFGEEGEMLVVVVVGGAVLLAYLRVMARGYRELKEVAAANRRAKAPPAGLL